MNREFNISMPISKIDEEQRMVYGFATVEEVDKQGEIVDYEASKRAFGAWPGNIREMHDTKRAVGKSVLTEFDDTAKGVWVGAQISRSADGENAWQKVKEGVLAGFSIGGRINKTRSETVKSGDEEMKANRIIDYDLTELSLVDNPACPSAVVQMVKSVGDTLARVDEPMVKAKDDRPHEPAWWVKAFLVGSDKVIEKTDPAYDKDVKAKPIEKSVYDASWLAGIATGIVQYISWEEAEGDDQSGMRQALKLIQSEIATEVQEGDDLLAPVNATILETDIELSDKPTNLIKGDAMKKAVVVGGTERDENAEEVTPAEEVKEEVAVKDKTKPEVASAVDEATEEDAEADVETPDEKDKDEKSVSATDIAKAVSAELGESFKKFSTESATELSKALESLDEAKTMIKSLEGRIETLEKTPAQPKVKASYVQVEKAADDTPSDDASELAALEKRADELAVSPNSGTAVERGQIVEGILKLRRRVNP